MDAFEALVTLSPPEPGYDVVPIEPTVIRQQLPRSTGRGKLCAVLFPDYQPETDLKYDPVLDNETGAFDDPSQNLPKERSNNVPMLVNIGGHRIGFVGRPLRFDASFSQDDRDRLPKRASWDFDDGSHGHGLTVEHAWATPGTYTVRCEIGDRSANRKVRILAQPGESDLEIVSVENWEGSLDVGWSLSATVVSPHPLEKLQGIGFYVDDGLDTRWRVRYEGRMRRLQRRWAWPDKKPAKPKWSTTWVETTVAIPGLGGGPGTSWQERAFVDTDLGITVVSEDGLHDDTYTEWGNFHGVPPGLLKAICAVRSNENAQLLAEGWGLGQLGYGSWATTVDDLSTLLDPDTNVSELAKLLQAAYASCGGWDGAVCRLLTGRCVPDGAIASGWEDRRFVAEVLRRWESYDEESPSEPGPQLGEMVFLGYISQAEIRREGDGRHWYQITCVDSAQALNFLTQRREDYFEKEPDPWTFGTVIGQPMKIAGLIHHLLQKHTNFPNKHDVVLDWSGPRYACHSAPEGPVLTALRALAEPEFGVIWGDRHGRLRHEQRHSFRLHGWMDEASEHAVDLGTDSLLSVTAVDRRQGNETVWVRLCGSTCHAACTDCKICQNEPERPRDGRSGTWSIREGLPIDDYKTLCRLVNSAFAYENREFDMQATLHWRHDLELHDLVRISLRDPNGLYDWKRSGKRDKNPVFVVTRISHRYDTDSKSWLTEISGEQLTSKNHGNCKRPKCHETCYRTADDPEITPPPPGPPPPLPNEPPPPLDVPRWPFPTATGPTGATGATGTTPAVVATDAVRDWTFWWGRSLDPRDAVGNDLGAWDPDYVWSADTRLYPQEMLISTQVLLPEPDYRLSTRGVQLDNANAVGCYMTCSETETLTWVTPADTPPVTWLLDDPDKLASYDPVPGMTRNRRNDTPFGTMAKDSDWEASGPLRKGSVLALSRAVDPPIKTHDFFDAMVMRAWVYGPEGDTRTLRLTVKPRLFHPDSGTRFAVVIGTDATHPKAETLRSLADPPARESFVPWAGVTDPLNTKYGIKTGGIDPATGVTEIVPERSWWFHSAHDVRDVIPNGETEGATLEIAVNLPTLPHEQPLANRFNSISFPYTDVLKGGAEYWIALVAMEPYGLYQLDTPINGPSPLDDPSLLAQGPFLTSDETREPENDYGDGDLRSGDAGCAPLFRVLDQQLGVDPYCGVFYGHSASAALAAVNQSIADGHPGLVDWCDPSIGSGCGKFECTHNAICYERSLREYHLNVGGVDKDGNLCKGLSLDPDGSNPIGTPICPRRCESSFERMTCWDNRNLYVATEIQLSVNAVFDPLPTDSVDIVAPTDPRGGGLAPGPCGNWPTLEAIESRIGLSERENGRTSPLRGLGYRFLELGRQHNVNPGVVLAILQRESQLGCDGSTLPVQANNYGGVIGEGNCGSVSLLGRSFARYCDPESGLAAVFMLLAGEPYASTDGTLAAVMRLYSPPSENDWEAMWTSFDAIAAQTSIVLAPGTSIYGGASCGTPGELPLEQSLQTAKAIVTQMPYDSFSHSVCDCYDFGVPVGTPIYPLVAGTVLSAGEDSVYGPYLVTIETDQGVHLYAHLSQVDVAAGDVVGPDDQIGLSGNAGTGPHLHLQLAGGAPANNGRSLSETMAAVGFNIGGFPHA